MPKRTNNRASKAISDTKQHKDDRKIQVNQGNIGTLTVQLLAEILKTLKEIKEGGN